ncbi:MAG: 2-isopropylmalate synthase [Chloroflexi bacterium]|nr:2-isopropylmalate synthase [Chloroflexota bacterium]
MAVYSINPQKVFFDNKGKFPPIALEAEPAVPPADSPQTTPKRITDTTLRDGAQDPRFALFPVEARLRYFDLLHKLDNGTGVIESLEVFIYQERDVWCLQKLLERGYQYPQVTTWTRATPKDIKTFLEVSGGAVKETGMLASASDHHIFDKLGFRSKEEAAEKYLAPILTAWESGIRPRIHLEDATKADVGGWVIPFMRRVLDETGGAARFRVCDTMGHGLPDPAAPLPYGIPRLIGTLARETGAELEFHGHNDFGLATANTIAAWKYGAKRANTAFAGLGERTGNTSLEQVLAHYIRLYGDPGLKLEVLMEIKELIGREVVPLSDKSPIIGDVFSTQAGIHQSGLERQQQAEGGLIYLPFEPELLGREGEEHSRIGALSGLEGIISVLNRQVKQATGREGGYSATSRAAKYVYDRIQDAYNGRYDAASGRWVDYRTTFFSPEEVLALAREYEARRGQA